MDKESHVPKVVRIWIRKVMFLGQLELDREIHDPRIVRIWIRKPMILGS